MKILPYNPAMSFKAHTYTIEPKSDHVLITTDNKPYLGNEPYLVGDSFDTKEGLRMKSSPGGGGGIKTYVYRPFFNYHIEYRDTKNVDLKEGKEYSLPVERLKLDATKRVRALYRQPLIHAFNEGSTVGKILYSDRFDYKNFDKISEPSIVVTKSTLIPSLSNKNILGLILTEFDSGTLGHSSANLRQETEISATVLDADAIEKLKSFDGKIVEISVADNFLDIKETDKTPKPKVFPQIEVPELEYCDEVLTSDRYSSRYVGAKAVNLRRLEELAENGKIDVIIPKSVALPYGFLEKNFSGSYWRNEEQNSKRMAALMQKFKEFGVNTKSFMVRSAFNGEDLPNYSAAGLYRTHIVFDEDLEMLHEAVTHVVHSKKERKAVESRKRHGIPDDKIKPSIVIQDAILPDYKFTVYTEYGKDNLRIDLYSGEVAGREDYFQPHVFNYDKKNKKLTYDSIQLGTAEVTYDENFRVINMPPVEGDLSENKSVFKLVRKLIDNALTIEKEFGIPQDIEGGFRGKDIYLWQTRNIVKKMMRKIS